MTRPLWTRLFHRGVTNTVPSQFRPISTTTHDARPSSLQFQSQTSRVAIIL